MGMDMDPEQAELIQFLQKIIVVIFVAIVMTLTIPVLLTLIFR